LDTLFLGGQEFGQKMNKYQALGNLEFRQNWKIICWKLYVEKVQDSIQAAGFKPTHSSLNWYCVGLVWPKIQQILCESTCDFIVFNHYMSKFSKSKTVMLKQKLQIILIISHYCAKPANVLWYNTSSQNLLVLVEFSPSWWNFPRTSIQQT
jgi:hypothetical protein